MNIFHVDWWKNLFTSRDSSTECVGRWEYMVCFEEPFNNDKLEMSPTFYVKNVTECSFNILLEVGFHENLHIYIKKNVLEVGEKLEPIAARIKLEIPDHYSHTTMVNEWLDDCLLFENVVSIRAMPTCRNCPNARFVKVECEITWLGFVDEDTPPPRPMRKLDDFLMSSDISDVTLVIGREEIPAHKVILASQSKRFKDILTSSETEKIELTDVELEAMKAVLKYLYTNDPSVIKNDQLFKVFTIAMDYRIDKLKSVCEHRLRSSLGFHNFVRVLRTAKKLGAISLYNYAVKFVSDNEKSVVNRTDFKRLCHEDPDVAIAVINMNPR